MYLTKVISNAVNSGVRQIKILLFGKSDVRTAKQVAPFGIDSVPIADMVAVYSDTGLNGQQVVVGYVNKSAIAQAGETRLYSADSNGDVQFYLWIKADGTLELNGTTDNAVRYQALEDGLTTYINALNAAITAGIASAGGTYTAPTTPLDISAAKIEEIKTT